MSLWWLEPGWDQQCCAQCGARIWPEGDPDWGLCLQCFDEQLARAQIEAPAVLPDHLDDPQTPVNQDV